MNSKTHLYMGWTARMCIYTTTLVFLVPYFILAEESVYPRVLVQTNSGPVEGVVVPVSSGQAVNTYYGIPFAQPPVGDLRFQPPQKVQPWNATLKADTPMPACYQSLIAKIPRPWSEDCLTLNIWTPNPKPEKSPVLVFIHGGGFFAGSSLRFIDGTSFSLEGVITVSMNYRLGVFGFLNLGIDNAPGNVGLMDQNLALQWIKENIEAFGGDPELITLSGLSAGSASVGYHLLAPKSKGLYNRAIMMSGAPTNVWGIDEPEKSIAKAKSLLESLGCPSQNSTAALKCLKEKHPDDIREATPTEKYVPTVDGQFIVEHPSVTVTKGNFHAGEVMVGTAADEAAGTMLITHKNYFKTSDGRLDRGQFLNVIKTVREDLSDLEVQALNVIYTQWRNPDDPLMLRDAAKDMFSDSDYVCRVNEFAESLSGAGNQVYRYVFDHRFYIPELPGPAWQRAGHAVDQIVFAPFQLVNERLVLPIDLAVFKRFLMHIVNFVKHGDPNLPKEEFPEEPNWPEYISGKQYNFISATSSIKSGPRTRECAFWLNLMPLLKATKSC